MSNIDNKTKWDYSIENVNESILEEKSLIFNEYHVKYKKIKSHQKSFMRRFNFPWVKNRFIILEETLIQDSVLKLTEGYMVLRPNIFSDRTILYYFISMSSN